MDSKTPLSLQCWILTGARSLSTPAAPPGRSARSLRPKWGAGPLVLGPGRGPSFPPSPEHLLRPGPLLLPATSPRGSRGCGRSAEGQFWNSGAARSPQRSAGSLLQPRRAAGTPRPAPQLRFPTCGPGPGAGRTLTGSAAPQQSGAGGRGAPGPGGRASARGAGGCRAESGASRPLAGPRAGCALRGSGAAPGSPAPLTLLFSRLHLFLPHPFLILLLSLFPRLRLLSAVSSLVFHWCVEKGGGGKSPVSLT